jgi:hypothetical protein
MFEKQMISGQGLSDEDVELIKSMGMHGRNVQGSEYAPYVGRLTALFNAEKKRRGK